MKKVLVLMFMALMAFSTYAQSAETIFVRAGKQKLAKTSKLKIKFVNVVEDSRCPEGTNCIWAGNAKVKVEIDGRGAPKTFEFNTTMGPKGDTVDGWSITLDSLTPTPKAGSAIERKTYVAKFTITRLQR